MAFSLDDEKISLAELYGRIEKTDLVPSRAQLLEGLEAKFKTLEQQGIATFAQLRSELKTSRRMETLSSASAIDLEYLVLLRREIESYFPKILPLTDFDWLPQEEIARLAKNGIRNTAEFYQAMTSKTELAKSTGVDATILDALFRLVNLTRIQWVSATFARMLIAASYNTITRIATANAETLCAALDRVNEGGRYFKGKLGLRDTKRLIFSAGYVQDEEMPA